VIFAANSTLQERARAAADRRRRIYGAEVPASVSRLLEEDHGPLGVLGALRLAVFVLLGSPLSVVRLWWRHLMDDDTPRRRKLISQLAEGLAPELSDETRVLVGSYERRLYSRDLGRVPAFVSKLLVRSKPLLVAQPRCEEDIVAVLEFAKREGLAVFPRGISSSAFGGTVPTTNGISLDLSAMSRVLEVDEEALTATVEPGVRWADLATALGRVGLAPLTTPTSRFSTIGGWASTGGVGIDAYRYGRFSRAIVAAHVVTPELGVVELEAGDEALDDCVGSEGQLGVFSRLTLRVRKAPASSHPVLLTFDDERGAFEFAQSLGELSPGPSHVVFFDRTHMKKEEVLAADRCGEALSSIEGGLFQARDTLLVHCDDRESEERLTKVFDDDVADSGLAARYLWTDRFFPLKGQRLGPNLLASEVVLGAADVPKFVAKARALGKRFGADVGFEATFCRRFDDAGEGGDIECTVIAAFACDSHRRVDYTMRLLLVQLLTHLAVRMGGRPYGLGLWNAPFVKSALSATKRAAIIARKAAHDPEGVLNPRKFFALRSRFWNLPGLLFRPWILSFALWCALIVSPILGAIAKALGVPTSERWAVPAPEVESGRTLLAEAEQRCTLCGACVSTCPAYLITRDEQVTGRSKLHLAAVLDHDGEAAEVSDAEAHSPFQCLRCGLCEEVCQTNLPLRDCYLAVEERVIERFGPPGETVEAFIERFEADKSWIEATFGLELADWKPGARGLSGEDGLLRTDEREVES